MHNFLQNIITKYDLHDLDIVVIKNNEIVEEHLLTNKTANVAPLQRDDLYRIASISKLFVGVAIMQLQEKGLLQLEDNIEDYVGFAVRNTYFPKTIITIEHILTHTSSFQDTNHLYVPLGEDTKLLFTQGGTYHSNDMYLPTKPGTKYHYYNTGFQLLAIVIEKLSGQRFDLYIEKHILSPLNMKGSFHPLEPYTSKHIHPLFRKENGVWTPQVDDKLEYRNFQQYILGTNGSLFSPQGGLRSNAFELSKFMMDIMNDHSKILKQETLSNMYTIRYKDNHSDISEGPFHRNNGIAFNITTPDTINLPIQKMQYTLIGHCGIAYGLHAVFFFDKEQKNGLIFSSTGHGNDWQAYSGNYSQFFNFQEDVFTYVDQYIWKK